MACAPCVKIIGAMTMVAIVIYTPGHFNGMYLKYIPLACTKVAIVSCSLISAQKTNGPGDEI